MARIESFLAARLFMHPQWVGDDLYFISNLSGKLSLFRMPIGGGIPQPLLPPDIALQNPDLIGGGPFAVFPELGQIVVMIDHDGDEVYRPHLIPLEGGFPEPLLPDVFTDTRSHMTDADVERNIAYFNCELLSISTIMSMRVDLNTGKAEELARSPWGYWIMAVSDDDAQVALYETYTVGDGALYLLDRAENAMRLVFGKPLSERMPGENVPLNGIGSAAFTSDGRGLLISTALFDDTYGIAYLDLAAPGELHPVSITGMQHTGKGELEWIASVEGSRSRVQYNIDGETWMYEGTYQADTRTLALDTVLIGTGAMQTGVLEGYYYDETSAQYAFSFSTATSPTQLYTRKEGETRQHTDERVLGILPEHLAPGEDASFTSHDGLRVSARLYLPAPALGYEGARPLVYYVHGGPQSQERPNFAWFSMPLIQYLTLNGFAVFVPNARGSTGYGLSYTKQVDRDWGGQDRLDHVYAMTHVLPKDRRVDVNRAAVVGRSYGGYMTLTLAARHPELWQAAVDMFGPYNLFTFLDRIPETWKPYFHEAVGDPERDGDLLTAMSPSTYIGQITAPLLVIQGKNDPRVVEPESRDVVERLRAAGKQVEYLVFENEGHDVLKLENRITCYNAITEFFREHLKP